MGASARRCEEELESLEQKCVVVLQEGNQIKTGRWRNQANSFSVHLVSKCLIDERHSTLEPLL